MFPFQYIAEKKLTTSYVSFPIYSRKEIETSILERKSKQKIPRFIDLIYRLFNIMLGSNWLIFFTNGRPGIY